MPLVPLQTLCTAGALQEALCAFNVYTRTGNFRSLQDQKSLGASLLSGTLPQSNLKPNKILSSSWDVCFQVRLSTLHRVSTELHGTHKENSCHWVYMPFCKLMVSVWESKQTLHILVPMLSEQKWLQHAMYKLHWWKVLAVTLHHANITLVRKEEHSRKLLMSTSPQLCRKLNYYPSQPCPSLPTPQKKPHWVWDHQ